MSLASGAVAPQFLQFTESPIDSDAIVVMVGPSYQDRMSALPKPFSIKGSPGTVIGPAYCVIFSAGVNGNLEAQLSMLRVEERGLADPSPPAIREGTDRGGDCPGE